MGIKCHNVNKKTGDLVSIKAANLQDSMMMITTEGILIRFPCSSISIQGRITSGVRLMNLEENVTVAGVAKVTIPDEEDGAPEGADESAQENGSDGVEAEEETAEIPEEDIFENPVDEGAQEEENDM